MQKDAPGVLKLIFRIIFIIAAVLYPALVYYSLVIREIPLRHFSLFIIAFALTAFIAATSRSRGAASTKKPFFQGPLVLLAVGVLCLAVNSVIILRFYPLIMNIMFLAVFGSTFFSPPNMIFRFAVLQDKSIKGSLGEKRIEAYCRKVTVVWCAFFLLNGSAAAWTIFFGTDKIWSIYNGGISYIIMGALFAGEFLVRKMVQKNIPKAAPLSALKSSSRKPSSIVCYEGVYSGSKFKTYSDFLEGTAKLRRQIEKTGGQRFLLYSDDLWHFLLAFTSLLQCKKEILLSANISPAYLAEIRGASPLLTDAAFNEKDGVENILDIADILKAPLAADCREIPAINPDETSIVMYTSGSTGKPKEVRQRLTELENDNKFVLSKWGEEISARKIFSTVSAHHIYGLLFSVLLPFTAGVPFRRTKIDFPEELEKFIDDQYMLITVPAFLKRAAAIKDRENIPLKTPWIFTSGGVLDQQTAKKTHEIFGFWPMEIYGSTETSGIAFRQSSGGPEWTPFDNVHLSVNNDGALVIRSPYIKDSQGFQTADAAQILDDGRFLLKGRIDSVVKIEEKRISVTEIEDRLLQSGFVSEACVVPLEDKRQYLAAAVVFNENGKARFSGLEKIEINNYWKGFLSQYFENVVIPKKWRYLQSLPQDSQGKKRKEEISLLFLEKQGVQPQLTDGFSEIKEKIIERTDSSITLEFAVPESSPYFTGHFPGFPILPAVAQIEIIVRLASRHLGTSAALSQLKRVKFTSPIKPFLILRLKLEKKEASISFKINSLDDGTLCSAGSLVPLAEDA